MAEAVLSRYIRPDVLTRVRELSFQPRQLVEGRLAGAHKSPFHGFAVEFAGHREYVPGDDLRHVDWKVYFRRDKLMIKQYEMETNLVCHLLLDCSASMRYGEGDTQKMRYAAQLASTLSYLIIEQSDQVSMIVADRETRASLTPSNSMGQVLRITEALDGIEPKDKTDLSHPLTELAARAGRRGIVILLSDFFTDLDVLEEALQRFRYDRHEVVLMQVLHRDEIDFEFEGMVRFEGLEIDEHFMTRPDDVREGYLEAMRRWHERLAELCDVNGCELLRVDTSRPMPELFADYLQQRLLVHRR